MSSARWVTAGTVLLAMGGCSSEQAGGPDDECTSHYEPVASASTWAGLRRAMLADEQYGHVESLRTQAQGQDVGAGDEDAVRVVDLLDRSDRRLVQVDVWRTSGGGWRAGAWSQCID